MAEDTEEDWFERALAEEPEPDESAGADETEEPEPDESAGADETEEPEPDESDTVESEESEPTEPAGSGAPDTSGTNESTEPSAESGSETSDSADETPTEDTFGDEADVIDIDVSETESFGFDLEEGAEDGLDEEEYHTDIPRIGVGIEGLDAMIQEGVPERSLMAVIGGAGTGKTTFALQFLQEALRNDGKAVFITLEENRERILRSASQKGWDFEAAVEDGSLAVLDLDPVDMANSLTSIRSELPRLVGDFEADRLVLDSVSLLEMMYDDQATRRTEIYDFANALKRAGVTTLVTSEASEDTAYASRFGIIEYLTDAVFVLQYVRPEEFQETRLAVEIQKIRDANHSRESKPYELTSGGIEVYRDATIF
ncbi:KaiC domain-containing protein [Halodesulfurarchaeum sp. HSR-GB]|uniref:KaiC domain-containing protein n=1 Tax=Halodesulfurarchaeum sp. HSR-GB TaxID=3074077 RepID=UPI0028657F90|nr:KaiC domain-containing protein [Halodesulfurarchaeum sp. HSR-GB]MDR5656398.1 KaiC domain-containing protein [Halodesulfurarchaeum sp. HSR-GB]